MGNKIKSLVFIFTFRSVKALCLLATEGYYDADFLCKHKYMMIRIGRVDSIGSDALPAGKNLLERKCTREVSRFTSSCTCAFLLTGGDEEQLPIDVKKGLVLVKLLLT